MTKLSCGTPFPAKSTVQRIQNKEGKSFAESNTQSTQNNQNKEDEMRTSACNVGWRTPASGLGYVIFMSVAIAALTMGSGRGWAAAPLAPGVDYTVGNYVR